MQLRVNITPKVTLLLVRRLCRVHWLVENCHVISCRPFYGFLC